MSISPDAPTSGTASIAFVDCEISARSRPQFERGRPRPGTLEGVGCEDNGLGNARLADRSGHGLCDQL